MRCLKRLQFVLITLLAVGLASGSVERIISAHVPVLVGETGEIEILEMKYLTWYAMPESRIQAVLWPYKINSPHEKRDGKNINPASMVNLRISSALYPESSCIITIDVRGMTEIPEEISNAYGPIDRRDLLLKIIEAIGQNLRADRISQCGLVIEGSEVHMDLKGVEFPAKL